MESLSIQGNHSCHNARKIEPVLGFLPARLGGIEGLDVQKLVLTPETERVPRLKLDRDASTQAYPEQCPKCGKLNSLWVLPLGWAGPHRQQKVSKILCKCQKLNEFSLPVSEAGHVAGVSGIV